MIVGAPNDDINGLLSGSAYVFQRSGGVWAEMGKLLASDGQADDRFGSSADIDGDTAVVGTREFGGPMPFTGGAYVFQYSGGIWTETQKPVPSGISSEDDFGIAVAIEGDQMIVGARFYDTDVVDVWHLMTWK